MDTSGFALRMSWRNLDSILDRPQGSETTTNTQPHSTARVSFNGTSMIGGRQLNLLKAPWRSHFLEDGRDDRI